MHSRKIFNILMQTAFVCLLAFTVAVSAAWAGKPTISGILKAYNPGGGRLQILRDDGVVKTVIMRPGCQFMMNGAKVSCNSFRNNMRVCVRICGSVVANPLECDLIADFMSSKNVVARKANTPNPTAVGGFAGTAGPAGTLASVFSNANAANPSIMGPLGIGGNFPGSLTNPGGGAPNNSAFPGNDPASIAQGANPAIQGSPDANAALADPSNPYKQGTAAPGAVQPIGTTVGQGQYPGGFMPGSGNPALANSQNPYASANPYGNNSIDPTNPMGLKSTASLINSGDDDDEEKDEGSFMPSQTPFSMQLVQFSGKIMSADARTRSITVLPEGQTQPIQVVVHQMVNPVDAGSRQAMKFTDIQPGMSISVQGMANTAGIIEARQVMIAR